LELLLVRHAIAEPAAPGQQDFDRPLSERGIERFGQCVAALGRLDLRIDALLHSPLVRAVQTADLMAPLLAGRREETDLLAAPPSRALLDALDAERAALVGHEPWMSDLFCLMLTGSTDDAVRFAMKKGAVAWLSGEAEPGGMNLVAHLPPRVLTPFA
jgi:phosphohistidine phosphatase